MKSIETLLVAIAESPENIEFSDVTTLIDQTYEYTPTDFQCGDAMNSAGTNEGSCKILAFAQLNELTESATLSLFGKYYREDVLNNPEGNDHANIRNFMVHGWGGVSFSADPLIRKA